MRGAFDPIRAAGDDYALVGCGRSGKFARDVFTV